jgi:hypothetical protein
MHKKDDANLNKETVPEAELPTGYSMTFQAAEWRESVKLPWYSVGVISQVLLWDLPSNRLETNLAAGSGACGLLMLLAEMVKPGHAECNPANGMMQNEGGGRASGVGVHLVVPSSEEETANVYTLRLPVGKVEVAEGRPVASGRFRVNLLQLPEFPAGEATSFVADYGKEWASEPATMGLIDRRQP